MNSLRQSTLLQLADAIEGVQPQSAYAEFKARYKYDPMGFVVDIIIFPDGESPKQYQLKILEALVKHHRVAVRGPHGLGKTAVASWAILWAALTSDDAKIATTASAWRQLTKYLWPEVHKWAARLDWNKIGRKPFDPLRELLSQSIKIRPSVEAYAVASNDPGKIEGAHAQRVFYIFDESKNIPDPVWDAVEGAFSTAGEDTRDEAFALAISTPGNPSGRFYDIHSRKPGFEDWYPIHVTQQETAEAGQMSQHWYDARLRQWGFESAVFQNRVMGEFWEDDSESLIRLSWIEQANERWLQHDWDEGIPGPFDRVGVDIGRGGDETVFALRFGQSIATLQKSRKADTMWVAGRVIQILNEWGGKAVLDVIGLGYGPYDRLKEAGYGHQSIPFNASESTNTNDLTGELGFVNKRSAAWWNLRELLDPQNGFNIALPPDDKLTGDLTAPHWTITGGGKIKIESKDDIKKRLGRSTDAGDAVVMAFWSPPTGVYIY